MWDLISIHMLMEYYRMPDIQSVLVFVVGFILIAIAAERLGENARRFRMPLITGYLLTGMLAGPFVLDLITSEATVRLRFVDEMALGFIAFAAGGELYLRELRGKFRSIAWVTLGLVAVTFVFGSVAAFLLAGMIPGLADLSPAVRLAASLLAGAILVARSPSSAIAVVKERRAHGPFTKTVLGVTVIMDVVVIIAFAGAAAIADAMISTDGFDLGFLWLLAGELAASLAAGLLIGHILGWLVGAVIAVLYNVPTACNRSTADFLISSELMSGSYRPTRDDYDDYAGRDLP